MDNTLTAESTAIATKPTTESIAAQPTVEELQRQLDTLNQQLNSERLHHQDEVSALRIQKLQADAGLKVKPSGLTPGQQEVARDKAIVAAGGLARFMSIPAEERAVALGYNPSEATIDEIRTVFGPTSEAKKANALARTDPGKYRRLRGVARELGIL